MNAPTRRATLRGASMAGFLGIVSGATAAAGDRFRPRPAGAAATPISVLNERLQALGVQRDEIDLALMALPEGAACDTLNRNFEANLVEILELYRRILVHPALTLEDAAIQAAAAYYNVESLGSIGVTEADLEAHADQMCRALSSITMAIVKAADLDFSRIAQGDMDYLCARWWPERMGDGGTCAEAFHAAEVPPSGVIL